jgi:hypothetical protein
MNRSTEDFENECCNEMTGVVNSAVPEPTLKSITSNFAVMPGRMMKIISLRYVSNATLLFMAVNPLVRLFVSQALSSRAPSHENTLD